MPAIFMSWDIELMESSSGIAKSGLKLAFLCLAEDLVPCYIVGIFQSIKCCTISYKLHLYFNQEQVLLCLQNSRNDEK